MTASYSGCSVKAWRDDCKNVHVLPRITWISPFLSPINPSQLWLWFIRQWGSWTLCQLS